MNCSSPTDNEYYFLSHSDCPFNHKCKDCEYDCEDGDDNDMA